MKKCSSCLISKSENEFTKRGKARDGLNAACKECTRNRTQQHYDKNKKYYYTKMRRRNLEIAEYVRSIRKKSKCCKCSEDDPACLDFHHMNGDKDVEISKIHCQGWSKERVDKEISKCQVFCSNCHRKLHRDLNVMCP